MTAESTRLTSAEISDRRTQFNAAIAENDALLRALADRIVSGGDTPLLQGTWTVRDGMCHLAARANSIPMVLAIAGGAMSTEGASASYDIDATNRQQIADRTAASMRDLVDETIAGHARAITELAHLDEETLANLITLAMFPQPVAVIDLMVMAGPGHDTSHLAEIQAALDAQ